MLLAGNELHGEAQSPLLFRYKPDGSFDTTFGDHGKVTIPPDTDYSIRKINAIALQPDGRIILAGSDQGAFLAYRLNTDGSLDQTFGVNGVYRSVMTGILRGDIRAAAVLPNGQILLGGTINQYTGAVSYDAAFVRLNSNGTPDLTFADKGIQGFWITDATDSIETMTVLPDGSVLAAGTAGGDFLLVKIDSSGDLVPTFGATDNGYTLTNLGHRSETARSIAVLPDGGIVLAGDSMNDIFLARYTKDGKPVTSFGSGVGLFAGTARLDLKARETTTGVFLSPNGMLVLVGTTADPAATTSTPFAVRFSARGRFDRTYQEHGLSLITNHPDPQHFDVGAANASAAASGPNGSVYVASTSLKHTLGDIVTTRLEIGGYVDDSFYSPSRYINAPISINGTKSVLQADGKIIVASFFANNKPLIEVTRFNADGSVDDTFADAGTAYIACPPGRPDISISPFVDLTLDLAGRVLIAAEPYRGDSESTAPHITLIRLTLDGRIDSSFSQNGISTFNQVIVYRLHAQIKPGPVVVRILMTGS